MSNFTNLYLFNQHHPNTISTTTTTPTTTNTTNPTTNTTYIIPIPLSNHDNDINIEYLDNILNIMRLICGKILTPILCMIGILSNIINIIILTREWMNSSTNIYLTAVSICDLLYLLFTYLFSLWLYPYIKQFTIYAYSITIIHGTANLFSNITTWLTVSFTLERYIVISLPIISKKYCNKQRAIYIIIIIFISCFILTLPDYLKKTIIYNNTTDNHNSSVSSNTENVTINNQYIVVDTNINIILIKIGYDYINQIIFIILPMILLIIFNSLLIRSVMKANQDRKILIKHNNHTNNSNNTSINMINDPKNIDLLHTNNNNNDNNNERKYSHVQLNQEATTSQIIPAIVRDALEASMRTTIGITSGITQSFRPIQYQTNLLPIITMKRNKLGEQQRITLMLITIVIAFVLLQLPSIVPTITINLINAGIIKSTQYTTKCLLIYSNISNVLLIINAALNFVFYSLFSKKFRQTCYILLKNITCLKYFSYH
ncbi:unnamed protein product [Schistosoma rodhaini]|uniref:G_PROTEIN_RECEP_F1_2 domain-containing protein n=1 Tax=Schistosoma rodhaini TaxID=6188 RepID=A0AA85GJ76_9TREM|nr:unnamed protein product [Schistosoma rodhaini]CAH8654431.1 unnamed protein product [Schistosoma rodhaini]